MSRRKIRPKRKTNKPNETLHQTVRFAPDGIEITEFEVPEEDRESLYLYIRAHELMPQDYVFDGRPESMMAVEVAAAALDIDDGFEIFRALAVLGHSPCRRAIETLTWATELPYPYGRVAHHALSECISIGQNPPPGFAGVPGGWPGA